jgi:hypothetical protein
MSLSAAIAVIVVIDVAVLSFVAWMMSHSRHLVPHVARPESPRPMDGRAFSGQPDMLLETVV